MLSQKSPPQTTGQLGRRSFLSTGVLAAAGAGLASLAFAPRAQAAALAQGDIDVLTFLAAAELLEADLWLQYSELATSNPKYRAALKFIDPSLPDYVNGDFTDELSHASLINAFLAANGGAAVNLDPFRTLPGSSATGSSKIGRLTNLSTLTVDTSYYKRYRENYNPDLGDTPPQEVVITNQRTIPTTNADTVDPKNLATIAQSAAFHFGMIEQGGSSLYAALLNKVSDPAAFAILAAIGPTEFWHFSLFMSALEGIRPGNTKFPFPAIRTDPTRGKITPRPTRFFAASGLPLTSVLRPSSIMAAGAVATANALVASNLFAGQSDAFMTAVTTLATNADNAMRSF